MIASTREILVCYAHDTEKHFFSQMQEVSMTLEKRDLNIFQVLFVARTGKFVEDCLKPVKCKFLGLLIVLMLQSTWQRIFHHVPLAPMLQMNNEV